MVRRCRTTHATGQGRGQAVSYQGVASQVIQIMLGHLTNSFNVANIFRYKHHQDWQSYCNGGEIKLGSVEIWQTNPRGIRDRKSTRLNSSHVAISYAVFCL